MSSISAEEMERMIDAGEEVIDKYFDVESAHIGTPKKYAGRRRQSPQKSGKAHVELPAQMIAELDKIAEELNLQRQAVVVMMLQQALNQHHLAKLAIATVSQEASNSQKPQTSQTSTEPEEAIKSA